MTKKLDGPIVAIGGSATGTVSAESEATWRDRGISRAVYTSLSLSIYIYICICIYIYI